MFDAIIWGLVQGLTEFLPISSSGHLVLVPAFLSELGVDIGEPSLSISAVLHLGTLLAVILYYRTDLMRLAAFRTDPGARWILQLLAIGTVPALVGLPLRSAVESFEADPQRVAIALIVTGVILAIGTRAAAGSRTIEQGTRSDAALIGVAQAFALVPGISRSGSTITAGILRGLDRSEAARFSFLLAIPTIAGGGLLSLGDVAAAEASLAPIAAGFVVAAVSGYAAIALLLRVLTTRGFSPFVGYCLAVGLIGVAVL